MAFNNSTKSTKRQINSLERQLRLRQSAIKNEKIKFMKTIKSCLSNPKTIVAATSIGFIVGEVTYRPRAKPTPGKPAHVTEHQGGKLNSSIENINRFTTSAFKFFTSAPVIALISTIRNSSSQKPTGQRK